MSSPSRHSSISMLLLLLVTTFYLMLQTGAAAAIIPPSSPRPPPPYTLTGSVLDVIMTNPDWSLLATAINTVMDPDLVQYLKMPSNSEKCCTMYNN